MPGLKDIVSYRQAKIIMYTSDEIQISTHECLQKGYLNKTSHHIGYFDDFKKIVDQDIFG